MVKVINCKKKFSLVRLAVLVLKNTDPNQTKLVNLNKKVNHNSKITSFSFRKIKKKKRRKRKRHGMATPQKLPFSSTKSLFASLPSLLKPFSLTQHLSAKVLSIEDSKPSLLSRPPLPSKPSPLPNPSLPLPVDEVCPTFFSNAN